MRYSKPFMMLFMLLVTLMTFVVCVSAQDIDVDSMSNEQLMQLLQAIMQKLESNETVDGMESLPDDTEMPVIGVARFSDRKLFTIYENKKLSIEAIPEYMFYQQPDDTTEPEKKEKKDDDSHGWVTDEHGCEPGEHWICETWGLCYCTSEPFEQGIYEP